MNAPGSLAWFARHELRLAWRDALAMMTGGKRNRERTVIIGALVIAACMHALAFLVLGRYGKIGEEPSLLVLITVTSGALLAASAMLSQAMESVTRAFYTRSDLELILSSPAPAHKLFAVRIGAMALSVGLISLVLIGPFIDILIWRGGLRWLGAYGAIIAVALDATALAVLLTLTLFRAIGPKRTRLVAQIVAAVIGGAFVIGLQMAAMFSTGTLSRLAFLRSQFVMTHVPAMDSPFWWLARAALGNAFDLAIVLTLSVALFLFVTWRYAPRFADCAIAAASTRPETSGRRIAERAFRARTPSQALRHKEWMLLVRDPWLISQTLMQLLYLLPPTVLLWRSFAFGGDVSMILVPVLIMSAGQLGGGLAWLTISGEDAPELMASAPLRPARILLAKIEAVMGGIAIVFCPFVFGLLFVSPLRALIAAICITASAAAATAIQLWFRVEAKRSQFRRRHTASRIATFAEAFSSIAWAGTGAVAVAGSWLAVFVGLFALALLGFVRLLSPARASKAKSLRPQNLGTVTA